MSRREAILEKVLQRIRLEPSILPTPCWLWTGPTSGAGYKGQKKGRGHSYPRMSLDGQTVAVHLVIWTHYNGFIPGRKQLDHLCRQRCCVNPEHLELVTHRVNQLRRAKARKTEQEESKAA